MFGRIGLSLFSVVLLVTSGCSSAPDGPDIEMDKVSKVTGKLLINGKPEQQVAIKLHRVGAEDPNAKTSQYLSSSAFTAADGSFAIGTYSGGDGAPDGEYIVTFQWGMQNLLGGSYSGDKFGGKYLDLKNPAKTITVAGAPIDMGVIELTAPEGATFEGKGGAAVSVEKAASGEK
jgi:hypothetical protein